MNWHTIIAAVMIVFVLSMFYLGKKIKDILEAKNIKTNKGILLIIILGLIISGIIIRPALIILFYSVILFIAADIIKFIFKLIIKLLSKKSRAQQSKSKRYKQVISIVGKIYQNGLMLFVIAILLLVYANYNAKTVVVTKYDININKNLGAVNPLNIVLISDLHLGTTMHNRAELDALVKRMNSMKPDLIVLDGDIFDENTPIELKEQSFQAFKNFSSKYGIYYVEGNHDRLNNQLRESLEKSNIVVLQDQFVLINETIYIIGRSEGRNGNRKNLSTLMNGVDRSKMILLLDHEPLDLIEAEKQGVDLQLSGHTHGGQLYPMKYVVKAIYGIVYGHLQFNNYNIIVTSGIGVWGFNARIGTHSEIVDIVIKN